MMEGSSIGRRLLLVAVLPVVAVLPLAVRSAVEDVNTFAQARSVAQTASQFESGAEVANAVRVEWLSAIDYSAVTSNDFANFESAVQQLGVEVLAESEEQLALASAETDRLLDASDTSTTVFAWRGDVLQRVEEQRAIPAELDLFYSRALADWGQQLGVDDIGSGVRVDSNLYVADQNRRTIAELDDDVVRLRHGLTVALERLAVSQRSVDWDELEALNDAVRTSVERADQVVSWSSDSWDDGRSMLIDSMGSVDGYVESQPEPRDLDLEAALDLAAVREDLSSASDSLIDVQFDTITQLVSAADEERVDARTGLLVTMAWFVIGILITAFFMGKASRWIVDPLSQAASRAEKISSGDLSVGSDVGPNAPKEVRALVHAFDGVADTVQTIQSQANAITRGDMDDPALDRKLPGNLGRNLEGTIGRWRETTMRLEHELAHDPVTEMSSLRRFVRDAEDVALASEVAIAVVAVDQFKGVNDVAGRTTGDVVLRILAERIRAASPPGAMTARLWSDEFAVLVPVSKQQQLNAAANQILASARRPIVVGADPWKLSATIGIAHGGDVDQVLNDASVAARHGKRTGGDQVVFHDDAFADLLDRRARTQAELVAAIEEDELEIWYQPVFDVTTNNVVSLEALVRWRLKDGTVRLAGDFIPIAEESDLIVEVDRWVIRAVCKQIAAWKSTSMESQRVAINVSARHAGRVDLPTWVGGACVEVGIDPACIGIEITETAIAEDRAAVQRNLMALRDLGVTIYLDDFGTGYSSLSYINDFPIDVLKIDRSFVDRLGADEGRSERLIGGIVTLARAIGMVAIAEGAETPKQIDALRRLGCKFVQGFALAEPRVPGRDLVAVCEPKDPPPPDDSALRIVS